MSTDTMPLRPVAPNIMTAHVADRAEARLETLRDELQRVRDAARPTDDNDLDETRLLFGIAVAERARDACLAVSGPLNG